MAKTSIGNLTFSTPNAAVATDFRIPGRQERFVGRGGDINASSKKDLLQSLSALLNHTETTGDVFVTEAQAVEQEKMTKSRKAAVLAAFDSPTSHRELGQVLANELYISANKQGFSRRFLKRQDLSQGQFPIVQMRMKNVVAQIASGPVRTETQFIRDNWFTPPEFYINARPFIEKRDIERSNTDVLEEKYIESLEGIMVQEDRTWRLLSLQIQGIANEATTIVGNLTPTALANLRILVTKWNVPAAYCFVASDLWADITGDPGFQALIDPVSKHELLVQGFLGNILGMTMMTDGYRHPTHHVLNVGEIFVVGEADFHGQYTDRGGIESQPIDGTVEKIPGRGWFMSETLSMVVTNPRSVAYAVRSAT